MNDDELHDLPEAERALARRLRAMLRESEAASPPPSRRRARARAPAAAMGTPALPGWMWASGGLTAAAAVAALVFMLLPRPGQTPVPAEPAAEVLEILVDEADPEFYEDLELYRWLAQGAGQDGGDA